MTLHEIASMILETIRAGEIMDDENLDERLIYDWIDLKRSQYIRNQLTKNPNGRLNLNIYQKLDISVEVFLVEDAGFYPYSTAVEDNNIVVSTEDIPSIIEDRSGPVILSIESEDLMKLPFSVVDYDYMRLAGNGKFNNNLIFASIRDNRIYFKYNEFFDTYTDVVLRALFENPREVNGFSPLTSEYPANLGLIEYIKNAIYQMDIKMLFSGKSDENNDADGTID